MKVKDVIMQLQENYDPESNIFIQWWDKENVQVAVSELEEKYNTEIVLSDEQKDEILVELADLNFETHADHVNEELRSLIGKKGALLLNL